MKPLATTRTDHKRIQTTRRRRVTDRGALATVEPSRRLSRQQEPAPRPDPVSSSSQPTATRGSGQPRELGPRTTARARLSVVFLDASSRPGPAGNHKGLGCHSPLRRRTSVCRRRATSSASHISGRPVPACTRCTVSFPLSGICDPSLCRPCTSRSRGCACGRWPSELSFWLLVGVGFVARGRSRPQRSLLSRDYDGRTRVL